MSWKSAGAALVLLLAMGLALSWLGQNHLRTDRAGQFDYYVLVLSWSPTYCRSSEGARNPDQCGMERAQGFVLHGLWPQYEHGWPSNCDIGRRPFVPRDVIDSMRDLMPDKRQIIHQYRKHGTCSGLAPEAYFETARTLYTRVAIPTRFADATAQATLTPQEIAQAFLAANPWLSPHTIAVDCKGGSLREMRLCFTPDLRPRACGANEDQSRLCPARRIAVPPGPDSNVQERRPRS